MVGRGGVMVEFVCLFFVNCAFMFVGWAFKVLEVGWC